MREPTDICLRTTRSSIVRPVRASSARRPSSAIPRLTEIKLCLDDENRRASLVDDTSVSSSNQTMSVYLRLKPRLTKSKRVKKIKDDTYTLVSTQILLTKFPSLESTASCPKKSKVPETTDRQYTFTTILGPASTQLEFFEETTKQRILDSIAGHSFTLMTYGTTNSGKSYTFYGNPESPGIIPRCIELIFSRVNCTLSPWYKPVNVHEVLSLNEALRSQEIEVREHFIASKSSNRSACEEAYNLLKKSTNDDKESDNNGEAMYSVWLSFFEIYNENIYDLLIDDESQIKSIPLKLMQDKQGRAFVQGLRSICATTGLDAYRIMAIGRSRLTIGSSSVNPQSSRSHSIFTIKLLKYIKEKVPEEVRVTTMTFCDLAGTGRSRNSESCGAELKESKKINTSLLVLGRCLKGISDCQDSRQNFEVVGSFRDSKLTRLFQRGILGKEDLSLVVNVDTSPEVYVETHAVLQFASIAKKITLEMSEEGKRFLISDSMMSPKDSENRHPQSIGPERFEKLAKIADKSGTDSNEDQCALLTREIRILRETALNREFEIRQEMANLYAGIIKDVEANWQKRTKDVEEKNDDLLKWSVKQIEQFYKERIDSLTNRKRRRISGGDQRDDGKDLCEELEAENSQITAKVVTLRESVKKLKEEQEILSADKNKCVFELSLAKEVIKQMRQLIDEEINGEIIDDGERNIVEDLRSLINEKNNTIRSLKSANISNKNNVDEINHEKTKDISLSETFEENDGRIIEERDIDAKFSSSTFRKESNMFLLSSTKYSIVEGENSKSDEKSIFSSLSHDDTTKNLQLSFYGTIDESYRSSSGDMMNSKQNDSGISNIASLENSLICHVNKENKFCQTERMFAKENAEMNEIIQGRVERLKLDHTKLLAEHLHENLRVTELSRELQSIQNDVRELKECTRQNELKIHDYEEKLSSREKDLSDLEELRKKMETRQSEVSQQLESRSIVYEKKITELREELKIHENRKNYARKSLEECQKKVVELNDELKIREDRENLTLKRLEEYKEKSSSLENQLSVAQGQIDKNSIKCFTEHVPKIEKLENELSTKERQVGELNEKIRKFTDDFERVNELNSKVTNFEKIFVEYRRENEDLKRLLFDRTEILASLEGRVKRLTSKFHERENEISTLRMDLGNVVKMNMENSERARELSKEIAIAHGRLASVRNEMTRSEEERRNLEKTSGHEIGNLIARLADFEKNATILARIRDNEDSRMDELNRLKLLLHEREREMCLLKKNRDKTIRRYEALIRKLQADVEMRCNRETSKLRMLYPKRSISKESMRTMAESLRWKTTLRQSVERVKSSQGVVDTRKLQRLQSSNRNDHRYSRSYPTCSTITKRSNSHALIASLTSLDGSRSSGSKNIPLCFDDDDDDDDLDDDDDDDIGQELIKMDTRESFDRSIQIESREDMNVDLGECHRCGRRDGLSQAAATFSIPSTSEESFADFRDMEIRRTTGRTHFRLRKGDLEIDSKSKQSKL